MSWKIGTYGQPIFDEASLWSRQSVFCVARISFLTCLSACRGESVYVTVCLALSACLSFYHFVFLFAFVRECLSFCLTLVISVFLSLAVSLCFRLCLCASCSVCLLVLSFSVFVSLSLCPLSFRLCLSVFVSIVSVFLHSVSVCQPVHLSVLLHAARLSASLPVCLPACLSKLIGHRLLSKTVIMVCDWWSELICMERRFHCIVRL